MQAIIKSENKRYLILENFKFKDDFFQIDVEVKSDWYSAKVLFFCSEERIRELILNLENIVEKNIDSLFFINEDGNFELNLAVNFLGKANVSGALIKSMMDEEKLNYEMESDFQSMCDFYHQLKKIVKQF
ncbi:hypothetical protein HZU77_016680 [Neisseriaceae bacterium TC5R-5]|nr:hypothetical protein [Neisseriaceae bacterium TC5R-5]